MMIVLGFLVLAVGFKLFTMLVENEIEVAAAGIMLTLVALYLISAYAPSNVIFIVFDWFWPGLLLGAFWTLARYTFWLSNASSEEVTVEPIETPSTAPSMSYQLDWTGWSWPVVYNPNPLVFA